MGRIRLCEVTPHLSDGGIETRVGRVLAGLSRDEFELHWIGFTVANPPLIDSAGPGVRIEAFTKRKTWTRVDTHLLADVVAHFRRIRPDVVRVHNGAASVYGVVGARLAGVPRVVYEAAGRESPDGPTRRRLVAMRAMAPLIDVHLAVCEHLAKEAIAEWSVPAEKVRVMPTGVDVGGLRRVDRDELRRRLGIPTDALVLGTMGMLRAVKRVDDIVRAGVRVLRDVPDAHLLVVGSNIDGSVPSAFSDMARAMGVEGRVHFPGRIFGAERAVPAFDVFVNASSFEGASNAIVEAMAVGAAVVATRAGGNVDVVEDGVTGLLVQVADHEALTAALLTLARDGTLRQRLGAEGARVAQTRHRIEDMVGAYAELFRELTRARS
jgi:glycosyltransferase involved in cell wall biosynthesis